MLLQDKRALEDEYRKTERSLQDFRQKVSRKEKSAFKKGGEAVIEDIVYVLCKFERAWNNVKHEGGTSENVIVENILKMLRDKYGLEMIDAGDEVVLDPERHRIVEVQRQPEEDSRIVGLSKGYRIGKRVVKPACLQVIEGGKAFSEENDEGDVKEACGVSFEKAKLKIVHGRMVNGTNPNGVA
jgi:molecular chaperone GrpE (heat shock protein)